MIWNVVDHLLSLGFETQQRLAEAAGTTQSAVAGWKARNAIPYERMLVLLHGAHGVALTAEDFVPPRHARRIVEGAA